MLLFDVFLYGEFAVHFCGSVFLVRFWFCYCSSDYFRSLSFVLFQSSHCCASCCVCSSCCCRLFDLALALCFLAMFLDLFLCFPLYSRLCSCCPAWETQYSKQQAEEKTILYWRNKQIIHHKNIKPKQARRRRKRKNNISYQFLPCVRFLKFHARLSSLFFWQHVKLWESHFMFWFVD